MADWTLGEIMSRVTRRVGRRSDLAASDVSFWVNEAHAEVCSIARHPKLEKTTILSVNSGTSQVALPTDFLEPISISFHTNLSGSYYTLQPIAPEVADAKGYWPVGKPTHYFVWSDKSIQLYPSADSSANTTVWSGRSYELRYLARPQSIITTTTALSVDTEWGMAVVYLAEALVHEDVGNLQEGAVARAQYASYVGSLQDAIARRQQARGTRAVSLPLRKARY